MENILQRLKDMHDILEHMHRIGDEWHTELVKLRADNQALQRENVRLQGLQKFIDARINSLHKNIDEKSSTVLAKIGEIHTKDIPATQAKIIGTKNSIAPLVEAKKFYDDELAALKQKQAELDNREATVKRNEEIIRNHDNALQSRQNQLDDRQDKLDKREEELNERESKLNEREKLLEARKDVPDADEKLSEPHEDVPDSDEKLSEVSEDISDTEEKLSEAYEDTSAADEKETTPSQNNHENLEDML